MHYAFEYTADKTTTYATMPDKVAGSVHIFITEWERDAYCANHGTQNTVEAITLTELRKLGWDPFQTLDFVAQ